MPSGHQSTLGWPSWGHLCFSPLLPLPLPSVEGFQKPRAHLGLHEVPWGVGTPGISHRHRPARVPAGQGGGGRSLKAELNGAQLVS